MNRTNSLAGVREGAPALGSVVAGLRRDPASLRVLLACTAAAAATGLEPTYLTLSTSFVQAGLRVPNSPAPMVVATAFLVLALITLLAGASADRFGRRRFLLLGLVGLLVSNVLGLVLLGTPRAFAFADALNALAGVVVLPAAMAIVTLAFEPAVRTFAYGVLFGTFGAALVIGSLLIPVLGEFWDGRATFIPAIVLGIVAYVLVRRDVPESRASASVRHGSIIVNLVLMAGLFVMMFLIVTVGMRSEESQMILAVAIALAFFVFVVRWLARRLQHFKGVEIYGGRDLGLALFAGVMLMFAQGCFFYQTIPFFYDVQQVGDVELALRYVPYVVGLLAGGLLVARLALRIGARRILALSFVLNGLALLALSFLKVDTPFWVMIVPITVVGVAAGLGGPARTTVVLGSPPEDLVTSAAAVNTAAGQAGYTLGVVVSSVLVTQHADGVFVSDLTAAGVSTSVAGRVAAALQDPIQRLVAAGYPNLPDAVSALTGASYADAFTSGMVRMFFAVAIVMFISALTMLLGMRRGLRATFAVPPASSVAKENALEPSPDTAQRA